MNNPKVKLLLFICLLASLAALISAFAAGSHFQIGFDDGAFKFDFKVATGHSGAATALGLLALAAGNPAGGEAASNPVSTGWSSFSDVASGLRRLTRSKKDEWLGGVCGGLGEHTPLPSWVWRLVFLLLLCCYGTGVPLYVLLWICLPEPLPDGERPGTSSGRTASAAQ